MEIRQRPNQKITVRKNGTLDIGTVNEEKTLTQQQFKDECDINNIVKRYSDTGILPVSTKVGAFLDVSNVQDYQTSLQTVYEAQKAFDALPSNIRSHFENDPNKLIAFIEDDANREEAIKLGLIQNKIPQTETQNPKTENQIPQKQNQPSP